MDAHSSKVGRIRKSLQTKYPSAATLKEPSLLSSSPEPSTVFVKGGLLPQT